MRNAIFYLTYNGLYNFTNGIGTQTQLLIGGFESLQQRLCAEHGSIDVHVVCPEPDAQTWGYDQAFLQHQQQRLAALGGFMHYIPYKHDPVQDLWDLRSWAALCQNVVPLFGSCIRSYDRALMICVDQPWLQTPRGLGGLLGRKSACQVDVLLVLYSTAYIRYGDHPEAGEVAWEQEGLSSSRPGSHVALADICPSFTAHLQGRFQLSAGQFAPYTSSILLDDPIFALLDPMGVQNTLQSYGIPLDADIVLAFGRAASIKGFERLIPALAPLRERMHFVLISVPYRHDDSQQQCYDQLLHQHGIRATHIKAFTRELPAVLCQWPRTKVVVVPSRHETFSNIPLEVALWARQSGPVVVASNVGGFVDQIEAGASGFLIDMSSSQHVTQTLLHVLDLPCDAHAAIRQQAYRRVRRAFDFAQNFPRTLRWFWQGEVSCPRGLGP